MRLLQLASSEFEIVSHASPVPNDVDALLLLGRLASYDTVSSYDVLLATSPRLFLSRHEAIDGLRPKLRQSLGPRILNLFRLQNFSANKIERLVVTNPHGDP